VPEHIRETVSCVGQLAAANPEGVKVIDIAKALHLDKSAASRRLSAARCNTSANETAGHESSCTVAREFEGVETAAAEDAQLEDAHDAAIRLLTQELGAEVVDGKPLGGELFVVAANLDFPRAGLPDGTTILATEECWRTFCKVALPHERKAAFRALAEIEASAT
jgi:hypothetical protein